MIASNTALLLSFKGVCPRDSNMHTCMHLLQSMTGRLNNCIGVDREKFAWIEDKKTEQRRVVKLDENGWASLQDIADQMERTAWPPMVRPDLASREYLLLYPDMHCIHTILIKRGAEIPHALSTLALLPLEGGRQRRPEQRRNAGCRHLR